MHMHRVDRRHAHEHIARTVFPRSSPRPPPPTSPGRGQLEEGMEGRSIAGRPAQKATSLGATTVLRAFEQHAKHTSALPTRARSAHPR